MVSANKYRTQQQPSLWLTAHYFCYLVYSFVQICLNWSCMKMANQIGVISRFLQMIDIMHTLHEAYVYVANRLKRRWWIRPVNRSRDEEGFFHTSFLELKNKDPEHFFKATRMTVDRFDALLDLLSERLQRYSRRRPISAEARLGLTLLYLSQGCGPQYLAWSHKLGESTVRKIVYETCEAIWSELNEVYVAKPNVAELKNIANRFYIKTGMPHCLGAIDGKHIHIVRPINSGSVFFNYKKTYSIVLLAICDSNYTFTYVDLGAVGSQSDGGILSKSAFGKIILRGDLEIPPQDSLPESNIIAPYFFVGDSAFPLKQNLMRPYPGRNLCQRKIKFNYMLSAARVHIENSFGILSNRWRVLHKPIHAAPKNVDKVVLATIVLHNYLMLNRDPSYFEENLVDHDENGVFIPGTWRETDSAMTSCRISQCNRSSTDAFAIREIVAEYLSGRE